ncbi:hypothetical protein ABPG75_007430 [Micractinium tetrahymenae]
MSAAASPAASEGQGTPGSKGATSLVITASRVKSLLRDEPDIKSISTEACFALAKAAELLVGELAEGGAARAARAGRRGSLEYADVAAVVAEHEPLAFLADIVPQTVKAAALLERMRPAAAAAAAGGAADAGDAAMADAGPAS